MVSGQQRTGWRFPTVYCLLDVILRLSMPTVYCVMYFRVAVLVSDTCQESPRCANYLGLPK